MMAFEFVVHSHWWVGDDEPTGVGAGDNNRKRYYHDDDDDAPTTAQYQNTHSSASQLASPGQHLNLPPPSEFTFVAEG
jgi:hypothetical protein